MPRIKRKSRPKFYGGKKLPMRAIRKANRKRKSSSLEKTVHAWLKDDRIEFRKEATVGRCHVDILLPPRTLIELNGCYWHGCMVCNRPLSDSQKLAQIKDARRYAFLRNRDYDVVVIWECEVDKEPERVRAMLRALAKVKKNDK